MNSKQIIKKLNQVFNNQNRSLRSRRNRRRTGRFNSQRQGRYGRRTRRRTIARKGNNRRTWTQPNRSKRYVKNLTANKTSVLVDHEYQTTLSYVTSYTSGTYEQVGTFAIGGLPGPYSPGTTYTLRMFGLTSSNTAIVMAANLKNIIEKEVLKYQQQYELAALVGFDLILTPNLNTSNFNSTGPVRIRVQPDDQTLSTQDLYTESALKINFSGKPTKLSFKMPLNKKIIVNNTITDNDFFEATSSTTVIQQILSKIQKFYMSIEVPQTEFGMNYMQARYNNEKSIATHPLLLNFHFHVRYAQRRLLPELPAYHQLIEDIPQLHQFYLATHINPNSMVQNRLEPEQFQQMLANIIRLYNNPKEVPNNTKMQQANVNEMIRRIEHQNKVQQYEKQLRRKRSHSKEMSEYWNQQEEEEEEEQSDGYYTD